MTLSIVTINYNNSSGLLRTVASVSSQLVSPFEHVIIDGMSTDGSRNVIAGYTEMQDRAYSVSSIIEPDGGIYDAMNKGILNSNGRYLLFLNSGDVFSDDRVVENILQFISIKELPDAIYGNVLFVDEAQKVKRTWISGSYKRWKFLFGWMPPHPSTVIRKELFLQQGLFNKNFKIAGDYELMLRMFYKNKVDLHYLNVDVVKMELGGVSTNGFRSIIKSNIECLRAWKTNNYLIPLWLFITKPLLKITQLEVVNNIFWKK